MMKERVKVAMQRSFWRIQEKTRSTNWRNDKKNGYCYICCTNSEKKAPILLSKNVVENMIPGSIMDLAAQNGGNCELTGVIK